VIHKIVLPLAQTNRAIFDQLNLSVLTLQTPDIEDIAKAIWERQRSALVSDAISHNLKWRDPSVPSKFWEEFLLDADAILALLYEKHVEFQKTRAT